MPTRNTRLMATAVFSGELDPDVVAACVALENAGFAVTRMPERLRPLLCLPNDDFIEAYKDVSMEEDCCCTRQIEGAILPLDCACSMMMREIDKIVKDYGGSCPEGGPIDHTHVPFAATFSGEEAKRKLGN